MQEEAPQINQEKNIAFDRPNMVKEHNEILEKWEKLDDFDKNLVYQGSGNQENIDMYKRKNELYDSVTSIDKYRELAKPKGEAVNPQVGDVSTIEKIKQEKEKIDIEVKKIKSEIEQTVTKLNFLREKLGMPPSDDIPSLTEKKQNLESLLSIQSDLESKLKFEERKAEAQNEENSENKNRENKNIQESVNGISSVVSSLSRLLDGSKIFKNQESFRILANKTPDTSSSEDVLGYFKNLNIVINDVEDISINEDPQKLFDISRVLKQLSGKVQEFTASIQDEEKRKEMITQVSAITENIDKMSSFITRKAQGIQAYKNVKLP